MDVTEDREWITERFHAGDTFASGMEAAIARGYERGLRGGSSAQSWMDLDGILDAAGAASAIRVVDRVRLLITDRDRLAKRCEQLERAAVCRVRGCEAPAAACAPHVQARVDEARQQGRDEASPDPDRLAALRSPEVVIPSEPVDVAEMQAQIHEADMDRIAASERLNAANAALATARRERDAYRKAKEENDERFMTERDDARRERDEAVAIVRDWLVWRSVHHVSDVHFPDLASVLSRARALVAGQATPDARDAEIAGWREASKAMTGEIATLRAQLDTALARVAELEAREVAANHRALGLQYELDTAAAELQGRDRESRWIIEHIPMMQGSPTFEARVAEYLSATPPADPARGLIERAVPVCEGAAECQHDGPGLCRGCGLAMKAVAADLRAYLAAKEGR